MHYNQGRIGQHLRIACSATCFNLAAAVRIVASWKVFRLEVRGVRIFAMVGRFNVYDNGQWTMIGHD